MKQHKVRSPKHQMISARMVDAAEWGILAALILNYVRFWSEKNERRNINYDAKHGRCLTRITYRRLEKLFPHTSYSSIRRAMLKLEEAGMLIKEVRPSWGDKGGACLALGVTDKYEKWFRNLKISPPKTERRAYVLNPPEMF